MGQNSLYLTLCVTFTIFGRTTLIEHLQNQSIWDSLSNSIKQSLTLWNQLALIKLMYSSLGCCRKYHWFEWAIPTFRGLIFLEKWICYWQMFFCFSIISYHSTSCPFTFYNEIILPLTYNIAWRTIFSQLKWQQNHLKKHVWEKCLLLFWLRGWLVWLSGSCSSWWDLFFKNDWQAIHYPSHLTEAPA